MLYFERWVIVQQTLHSFSKSYSVSHNRSRNARNISQLGPLSSPEGLAVNLKRVAHGKGFYKPIPHQPSFLTFAQSGIAVDFRT